MGKSKKSSASITKKLNGALNRRKLARSLLWDVIIAVLVIAVWAASVEAASGGKFTNITNRRVVVTQQISLETRIAQSYFDFYESVAYGYAFSDNMLPFDGIEYRFDILQSYMSAEIVTVSHDASGLLTAVTVGFLAVVVIQLLGFVLGHFTGRGLIRKYLRPIDDIAIMAEKISSAADRHTADKTEVRAENSMYNGHDDTDISRDELESLADAIDGIDSSSKRIEVHQTELGGLEAALNNMLLRLEAANRKQIRFVDDASHELRTPISVIQGYANMLDRWGKDDPKIRDEAIEAIRVESEHMKTLIDQLLFLARGEMDRISLNRERINVCELVDEIMDESVMLDPDHEYSIASLPDSEDGIPPMILADAALIKQSVRILRDNAAKYTEKGGSVTFRLYEKTVSDEGDGAVERICIEVSDSGVGIPARELPRIFDRFYRGEEVRANNASGSGLGLSIAKWIVDVHGGKIEAVSGVGIGTRMTVILDEFRETENR